MSKKRHVLPVIFGILFFIIIGIPLIAVGLSFIGRITPDSVIPDSFDLYASIPNPADLAGKVLSHESLPDIIAAPELAPLMPAVNQVKGSGITDNPIIRFAAKGRLDAAILPGGRILAAWDAGIVSPFFKLLPALAGFITIKDLYYVNAGSNSRFEYRLEDGTVFFIAPYKNLVIISNNSALFESVLAGSSREGDRLGSGVKSFYSQGHDAAFLVSPEALTGMLGGNGETQSDPYLLSAMNLIRFPAYIEASLSVMPNRIKLNITSPVEGENQALQTITGRNSEAVPVLSMIPSNAQYLTLLSAGNLKELLGAVSAIASGTPSAGEFESTIRRADSSARLFLGMDLEELLFSWTGYQFAVYGLEGRANPVIAIEIKDENKRRDVFNRAFGSFLINENIQLTLDGNRIPRIQMPGFLDSFLRLLGVNIPSPYYTVQNNCLLVSESAETLLAAVNAVRRNDVLPKTDLWRLLSEDNSGPSSFSLFYSLDRSLPFFLRGSGALTSVLRLYRQGLARIYLENSVLKISLQAVPGAGKGLVPVTGYPFDLGGHADNRLYKVFSGADTRLLLARGGNALILNPSGPGIKEAAGAASANLFVLPAQDALSGQDSPEAAWTVNSQGQVNLLNSDAEAQRGFPLSTGIRLSSPPAAWGGKLFLCDEDGSVYTVDNRASVNKWGSTFHSPLRSPPSFLNHGNKSYAASYVKSFIGEIRLHDLQGAALPGWPLSVTSIAFGSPLIFAGEHSGRALRLFAAFITQAGELSVYTEDANMLPGFPIDLDGVFYLQPVFDGQKLWIIESEGTLYSVDLNAGVLSHKVPRLSVRENGFITAADIDGDKNGEIFFSGEGNALYGYTGSFNSLDGFPLPVWGRAVIDDINGDGKTEAAGVGMDNRLYMWQFR